MAIERFSREAFESALPRSEESGTNFWEFRGFDKGERVYMIPISDFAKIMVRSSIDHTGYAADVGNDSIRLWLEIIDDNGNWRGSKSLDAYTNRTSGWDRRMAQKIDELWALGNKIKQPVPTCKKCKKRQGAWFTKSGKNVGRPASKCFDCDTGFTWLDEKVVEKKNETDELIGDLEKMLADAGSEMVKPAIGIDEDEPVIMPLKGSPNAQQKEAIDAPLDKACRMIAGPGSGKSKTLLWRIERLLDDGVHPDNILAVTFNKTMADELLLKALAAFPEYRGTQGENQICTIHALCFRLLREWGEKRQVPKTWQIKRILQEIAEDLWPISDRPGWEEIVSAIANTKNLALPQEQDFVMYDAWFGGYHAERLTKARIQFDKKLKEQNLLPFFDMLYMVEELINRGDSIVEMWKNRFKYVMIDEGQDTSGQAMRVLSQLASKGQMFIVGDTDQLLYRFTGATPEENLQTGFDELYPDGMTYMLETNYRSTSNIIDTCNRLIKYNYQNFGGPYEERFRKNLVGRDDCPRGLPVGYMEYIDVVSEANAVVNGINEYLAKGNVKPGDIFIGARTKAQLGYLEGPLMAANIPFINITGGSFWQMKHIRDVYSYVLLAGDMDDSDAFSRVYNIASNHMVQPWGKLEGEYCTHRYLGRQFLDACGNKFENIVNVMDSRRSWRPGGEDLLELVHGIQEVLFDKGVSNALQYVIDNCYREWLKHEEGFTNSDEAENGKLSDLATMVDISRRFDNIEDMRNFVDQAIKAAEDAKLKNWDKYVVLSTIHRLKGLERPIVYGVGWSEGAEDKSGMVGMLPHTFSMVEPPQNGVLNFGGKGRIEDERCMAFVLISRAMECCHLSGVRFHRDMPMQPSRFLYEAGIIEGNSYH